MAQANRRSFLKSAALSSAALAVPAFRKDAQSPNEKFRVALMGVRGRGRSLLYGFAELEDVEVTHVCDVDTRVFEEKLKRTEEIQGKRPKTETDFRRLLDDPSIDAIVMGTPTHWHAIPTILACQAGKHVYVEKPASHNMKEGRAMVEAARKYDRVVQVGIQSRSGRFFQQAFDYIRSGVLGKVRFAKGWESAHNRNLGFPADSAPPAGVDYDMWLGPAPKRPFNPLRFHSNWRWFFDYGCGDLGNDGVHRLDYARRGLEAGLEAQGETLPEWPTAVSASGGKLVLDDCQEWPDTQLVMYDYPNCILMYEMRLWSRPPLEGLVEGAAVYGENGYVIIGNRSWRAYGPKAELLHEAKGSKRDDDIRHKRDFLSCIKNGGRPACDIGIGHVASGIVHLGNIAWRTNNKLKFDAASETFTNDEEANGLLGRTYREPWTLPKV